MPHSCAKSGPITHGRRLGHTLRFVAFLDEEMGDERKPKAPEPRKRPESARRRQNFMTRRLVGVGGLLLLLLLSVLAFKGCLDARENRAITTYLTESSTIMSESEERGGQFFALLENPGSKTDLQYKQQIQLIRGASESLLTRAEEQDVPDRLAASHGAMTLALEMRSDALTKIADDITAALGDAEQAEAIARISEQMGTLYGSDVVYAQEALPEMRRVADDEGIEVQISEGNFMPPPPLGLEWLDQGKLTEALAAAGDGTGTSTGTTGVGLLDVTIDGVSLSADAPTEVSGSANAVEVLVQNQGESEQSGVEVLVSVDGTESSATVDAIGPGESQAVTVTLSNAPPQGEEVTVEVRIQPVPGETVTDNNSGTFQVTFG